MLQNGYPAGVVNYNVNKFYGYIDLRVIFHSARRIKSFFPYKDIINRSQMSKVVYKASCWDCQDFYRLQKSRFRKARSAVGVILECEAREPHTPHTPAGRLSPFSLAVFSLAPAFRSNMVRRSRSQKIRLFCSLGFLNVDCMTGKLNILKVSQVPVMHLLSLTTSRKLVTT